MIIIIIIIIIIVIIIIENYNLNKDYRVYGLFRKLSGK